MPTLTDEQLAALRAWREDTLPPRSDAEIQAALQVIDAILAANPAPEPPWEPSGHEIDEFCTARAWARSDLFFRGCAAVDLSFAHKALTAAGYTITPPEEATT